MINEKIGQTHGFQNLQSLNDQRLKKMMWFFTIWLGRKVKIGVGWWILTEKVYGLIPCIFWLYHMFFLNPFFQLVFVWGFMYQQNIVLVFWYLEEWIMPTPRTRISLLMRRTKKSFYVISVIFMYKLLYAWWTPIGTCANLLIFGQNEALVDLVLLMLAVREVVGLWSYAHFMF